MSHKYHSKKLFYKYYKDWIVLYKEHAVREVTLDKYYLTYKKLIELAPDLHLNELNRRSYQKLLNDYALNHERKTTMDFHHHLKAAILDAVDDGLLEHDPTRRIIIKGCAPKTKKKKFLNMYELQCLLRNLELGNEINWDWFILLIAKTGLRFSEALALTPADFDFEKQMITINKSWDYKSKQGAFQKTKNSSSNRKVMVDWKLMDQFRNLISKSKSDLSKPIFITENQRVFNSSINALLKKHCLESHIPIISIHALRHTHASLLLYEGVSVASVAKRLGHANTTTTQETYLHIIKELENKDNDKVLHTLAQLG